MCFFNFLEPELVEAYFSHSKSQGPKRSSSTVHVPLTFESPVKFVSFPLTKPKLRGQGHRLSLLYGNARPCDVGEREELEAVSTDHFFPVT